MWQTRLMLTLAPRLRIPRLRLAWRRAVLLVLAAAFLAYSLYIFAGPNAHAVLAGRVYRTAQLSGPALASHLRDKQIRTVINLRGHCPDLEWYRNEAEAIVAAGASQEDITLSANRLPAPVELRRLIEVLDRSQYPVLLHCKQGADRTGLASAVVLLLYTDASLRRARMELWPHRGHFPVARTVAMDDFFDRYERWLGGKPHTPERFREWALHCYKPGVAVSELTWVTPPPAIIPAGQPFALTLRATNRSDEPWQFTPGATAGIHLTYRLHDERGEKVYEDAAGLLRRTVPPGESIDLLLAFSALPPGRYRLRAELADFRGAGIAVRASYFFQFGSEAMIATLEVK